MRRRCRRRGGPGVVSSERPAGVGAVARRGPVAQRRGRARRGRPALRRQRHRASPLTSGARGYGASCDGVVRSPPIERRQGEEHRTAAVVSPGRRGEGESGKRACSRRASAEENSDEATDARSHGHGDAAADAHAQRGAADGRTTEAAAHGSERGEAEQRQHCNRVDSQRCRDRNVLDCGHAVATPADIRGHSWVRESKAESGPHRRETA